MTAQVVHSPPLDRLGGLTERAPWVALMLLFGIQIVVAAVYGISQQPAISEVLTAARKCVELNDCASHGPPAAGVPLYHGATWVRLLSYSLQGGFDQTFVQFICLGLFVLALGLWFVIMLRYLGLRAATLGLGLCAPVALTVPDFAVFTYSNLLPLPFAVFYASMALFTEFRRTIFGAVASIALAAAVSVQLGCIILVPFILVLVALTAPRPWLAVATAGLGFAIPYGWSSMESAHELVRHIPTVPVAVGLLLSGGGAALVVRMRPKFLLPASMPTAERVRAVMTAALIYATVTVLLAGPLLAHGLPNPKFLTLPMFPFLYLVAEPLRTLGTRATVALAALVSLSLGLTPFAPHFLLLFQAPVSIIILVFVIQTIIQQIRWGGPGALPARSLWPAVSLCLCVVATAVGDVLAVAKRSPEQAIPLALAEKVVPKLYEAGYTYSEILGSLQGPGADDVVPLLADRDPDVFGKLPPPLTNENFSLLLMTVPNTVISRAQGLIATVPVDDSTSVAVVRGGPSYLDWIHMRRCRWRTGGDGPPSFTCMEPRTDQPVPHNWPFVEFSDSSPLLDVSPPDGAPDWSVQFQVPVHTPGDGVPHIVRTGNEWPLTWRITRVRGVEFEGELPGSEIRLPDKQKATGVVELEISPAPADLPWVWIPHVMEVAEENGHLLEPFRRAQ